MKTLKVFFLTLSITLLSACNKDNNDNATNPTLTGTWNLVKVSGGLIEKQSIFPREVISWRFDDSSKKVTITNNNDNPDLADVFKTGTYDYVITNNGNIGLCERYIVINKMNFGCLTFIEGNLRIDNSYLDGARIEFIR